MTKLQRKEFHWYWWQAGRLVPRKLALQLETLSTTATPLLLIEFHAEPDINAIITENTKMLENWLHKNNFGTDDVQEGFSNRKKLGYFLCLCVYCHTAA